MLAKCCCCVPLRTGSFILGVLGILSGIVTLISSGGHWFYIVDAIFYLIAYGALLLGALKYNPQLVLINLVITALAIAIGIVFGIVAIAFVTAFVPDLKNNCATMHDELNELHINCDQFKAATIGTTAAVFFVASGFNVYFWICNMSYYKELKSGGGNLH